MQAKAKTSIIGWLNTTAEKLSQLKMCIPWRLIWSMDVATRCEALMLEKKIKSRGAARFLADARHSSSVARIPRGAFRAKVVSSNLAAPDKKACNCGLFSL